MDTTRKFVEGMMDAIASAKYQSEINDTLSLLLTALEEARKQLSAAKAERDTLKALCVELADSLAHMRWCQSCAEDSWASCPDGKVAEDLLTRARSILS